VSDAISVRPGESRALLARLGIAGEMVSTPGHSEDSVCLVLDGGVAFSGDLANPAMIVDESDLSARSWRTLRALNVKTVYPGHGPEWVFGPPAATAPR
jgi:endoribonuclease LACTB2